MNYRILFLGVLALTFLIEAGHSAVVEGGDPNMFTELKCLGDGNYTSTYGANLNSTVQMLHRNVDSNGFYNSSAGQGTDRAYAMVLCRGDAQLDECKDCILKSAEALSVSCPLQRQAIRWEYPCMLRYSKASTYGVMDSRFMAYLNSPHYATNPDQFEVDASGLLRNLTEKAASGGSLRKVAAGDVKSTSQTISGMVQCTPDLTRDNCTRCVNDTFGFLSLQCGGKDGCRLFSPSCNLRYEVHHFYDETRLRELEAVTVPSPPSSRDGGNTTPTVGANTTPTVVFIVVPIVFSLIAAVPAVIWFRKRRIQQPTQSFHETVDEISTPKSLQYDFNTIKTATNDFSDENKLGHGGFGSVYKGILPNGQEIAVKRLSRNSGQGNMEFLNEIVLLAKLQHRNLVRLLGFSIEGAERLIIYELVQNASLDHFIFGQENHSYLDWDKRYKIIVGIAKGILYLHEDSRHRIIHRDLKASNVLLDREMNPKIADFGMARLFGQDETQANTSLVVGTYGYMPPEYILHGQFSIKTDVFSFGVLVLEIISGRQNNQFRSGENTENLLSYAWKNWREGTTTNVVDPLLRSGSDSMSEILRLIHISLLCVRENASDRPTMASVLIMLGSSSFSLALPSEPAFHFPSSTASYISEIKDNNLRRANDHTSTKNDVSITELSPR